MSAEQWFGGANGEPPKFDMESLYNAESETAAVSTPMPAALTKPFTPPTAQAPTKTTTAHTSQPSISSVREQLFKSPPSPVKETPPPLKRDEAPAMSPNPQAEFKETIRTRSPTKGTFTPPPLKAVTPPRAATPPLATPSAPSPNEIAISEQLQKITLLLESQNKTLISQNDQIRELTKEVDTLKEKVGDGVVKEVKEDEGETGETEREKEVVELLEKEKGANEELAEESRRKDEIIRKLELELEEARS